MDATVTGELYLLRHPAKTLKVLDEYEGEGYRRELHFAFRDTARPVAAWVYIYRFALPKHRRISSGVWE